MSIVCLCAQGFEVLRTCDFMIGQYRLELITDYAIVVTDGSFSWSDGDQPSTLERSVLLIWSSLTQH